LGHIQRGGSPSARDRALATRFGYHAVKLLMEGQTNVMVGIELGKIVTSPLDLVCQGRRDLDVSQLEMIDVMAI
jgi:6-phosphofructokinase 1